MKKTEAKKFTMNDVFKHKKEALLMARMQSADSKFENTFARLIEDLRSEYKQYYGNRKGYGTDKDPAYSTCWRLSIDEFCDLTPYYKAFGATSRELMKNVLIDARRWVSNLQETDKSRHIKRGRRDVSDFEQDILCENKKRLTPLQYSYYEHFINAVALKRFRPVAVNTCGEYKYYSSKGRTSKSKNELTPCLSNRIDFYVGDKIVNNHAEWIAAFTGYNPNSMLTTNSALSILALAERKKDMLRPEKTRRRTLPIYY